MTDTAVVFIVDDDTSFRRSLSRLLRAAGLTVAPFASAEEFLEEHDPAVPGCLVLDLAMPGLDGLELQNILTGHDWQRPVIFLSGRADVQKSVQAMKNGAADFLTKPVNATSLLAAIKAALERDAAARLNNKEASEFRRQWSTLTLREREVARHVMAGRLNKQIAGQMGTVERTVKFHRSHVMTKLNVDSVADLVRLAERAGIHDG
jgi:FixJ family two-component response regulator